VDNKAERRRFDQFYAAMDISLDTYPLTGGTTTVDALDSGLPVISLRGPALHQRISWAVLNHVGVPELCADTPEGYVALAAALAQDRDRLAQYRATLRDRVRQSCLCDAESFARDFQETMATVAARHAG